MFAALLQAGGSPEVGTAISARILDVNKKDGIVDLSLKPDLVQAAQSVRKRSKNNAAEGATLPAVSTLHATCDSLPLSSCVVQQLPGRKDGAYHPKTFNTCSPVLMQEQMHKAYVRQALQTNCPHCCAGVGRSAKRWQPRCSW